MRRSHQRAIDVVVQHLRAKNAADVTVSAVVGTTTNFLSTQAKRFATITGQDVKDYLAQRSTTLKRSSLGSELTRLRTFFRIAHEYNLIGEDPTAGLEVLPSDTNATRRHLTQADVAALLQGALDAWPEDHHLALRDRACLEILYGLGLRQREAQRAQMIDLDLAEGLFRVRSIKRGPGRTLPVPPAALVWVRRYLEEARPKLVHADGRDQGHLLLTYAGRPLPPRCGVWQIVDRAAKASGVPARPHLLRHAIATHFIEAGVSVKVVSAFLGHRCLEVTARYLRVDRRQLHRAVATLERSQCSGAGT